MNIPEYTTTLYIVALIGCLLFSVCYVHKAIQYKSKYTVITIEYYRRNAFIAIFCSYIPIVQLFVLMGFIWWELINYFINQE